MPSSVLQLLPEALLFAGALVALFGDMLPGRDRTALLAGAALSAAACVAVVALGTGEPIFREMLVPDSAARFIRASIAGLTALWLVWLADRGIPDERSREAAALALFSAGGGMLLAMSRDLITMYMALELSTMPAYVLMGYRRRDVAGLEGALKYFLMSLVTSLTMLYGLSFVFGITGETDFARISLAGSGALGLVAALLAMVGLFAKMSAAPFHFWAPDAYAGAPAASVAFVSTIPKLAGTAAMVRLAAAIAPGIEGLALVIAVVAAASMALGNLAALPQSDLRRLMAYSGIAHSGYLLMGLSAGVLFTASADAAGGSTGFAATLYYALAYAVPSMAVMFVVAEEGADIRSLAGLATRRPAAAWAVVLLLVSLIGIPPLAGFFGKLGLIGASIDAGQYWLAIVAVVASVVSAGYYFRIVREMFFGELAEDAPGAESPAAESPAAPATEPQAAASARAPLAAAALAIAAVATLAIGVGASPLLGALGL